ncbi:hypothetical protein J6590_016640 [Homalodisca vitripennis]|nr:hypothetical protein J6590_016640 [Homalodisca vitripennis]
MTGGFIFPIVGAPMAERFKSLDFGSELEIVQVQILSVAVALFIIHRNPVLFGHSHATYRAYLTLFRSDQRSSGKYCPAETQKLGQRFANQGLTLGCLCSGTATRYARGTLDLIPGMYATADTLYLPEQWEQCCLLNTSISRTKVCEESGISKVTKSETVDLGENISIEESGQDVEESGQDVEESGQDVKESGQDINKFQTNSILI